MVLVEIFNLIFDMEQAERLFDSLDYYKLFDDRTASRSLSLQFEYTDLPIVGKTRFNRNIIIISVADSKILDPLDNIREEGSLLVSSIQKVVRVNPNTSRSKIAHTQSREK